MRTYNPIRALIQIYGLDYAQFSRISGIPPFRVMLLAESSHLSDKDPSYARITDEQYQKIADFFETPFSGLKEEHPNLNVLKFITVCLKIVDLLEMGDEYKQYLLEISGRDH